MDSGNSSSTIVPVLRAAATADVAGAAAVATATAAVVVADAAEAATDTVVVAVAVAVSFVAAVAAVATGAVLRLAFDFFPMMMKNWNTIVCVRWTVHYAAILER